MSDDVIVWKLAANHPKFQCNCFKAGSLHSCPAKAANTLMDYLREAVEHIDVLTEELQGWEASRVGGFDGRSGSSEAVMTPDLIELGRRAVACKGWRWVEGMRVRRWDDHLTMWKRNRVSLTADRDTFWLLEGWVPDLEDPATVGCILALVREVWTDPRIHAAPALYSHEAPLEYQYTISHWHVYSPGPYNPLTEPPKCAVTAKTEAKALVAALEAAP